MSHLLYMFGGHWPMAIGGIKYLICYVTSQSHVTEGSSMVLHQFAKVSGHKHCSSKDIILLACHVINQDHVNQGSGGYNDTSPLM